MTTLAAFFGACLPRTAARIAPLFPSRRALLGLARSALLLAPLLAPLLAILLAASVAQDGVRVFQVAVLALPGWLWLCRPCRGVGARALQAALCALLAGAFALDASVRGFLVQTWQATPSSAMIMSAMANATRREAREFLAMYWHGLAFWAVFLLVQLAAIGWGLAHWWRHPPAALRLRGWRSAPAALLLLLVLAAFAIKPWRCHHPLAFWPQWAAEVATLKRGWSDLGAQRRQLLARAAAAAPVLGADSPDTLVLVIGESVNRAHLAPYGYPRDTTPQLAARQRSLGGALEVFRHAWSVDASTVPALRNLFYFGQPRAEGRQHLLALARAAGYRVWWISNHDDLAIEQEHARLADEVRLLNQRPGRSAHSLDEQLLPLAKAALADPAPRKLIVVHLLGLHPHYRLRHPGGTAPFGALDAVEAQLREAGRPAWLRALRKDYDTAMRYHDRIVAGTLDLCRAAAGKTSWIYLSDHGQEVGHSSNHAGHSASTPDGYRIPLMVWRPAPADAVAAIPATSAVLEQPVRGDWLGHSLAALLGLDWAGARPEQNVFDARYRWRAPRLPVSINFRS